LFQYVDVSYVSNTKNQTTCNLFVWLAQYTDQ
jgi:hypothetical protein